LECHEASKHHLLKFGFFLLDSINLDFLLRERLATVLIIPSSWGSQLGSYRARIKLFFWRRCRGKRRFLQGESRTHNLYFVLVLLYFIFTCIVLSKIKKLVPSIVVIFVGLLLSCFIMLSINGWFL
jgi:hypothetical protein